MVVATQEACIIATCLDWILITGKSIANTFYVQNCGCIVFVYTTQRELPVLVRYTS